MLAFAALHLALSACEPAEDVHGGSTACEARDATSLAPFAGDFGNGDRTSDGVVTFFERRGDLLMYPALWDGPMVLRRVDADSFVVAAHPRFGAAFLRGSDGCVTRARIHGLSQDVAYVRLAEDAPRPVQLLLAGRPREAARAYVASDSSDVDRFVTVGRRMLNSAPTRIDTTIAFFTELTRLLPQEASVQSALGDALVASGRRDAARQAYARALQRDPGDEAAVAAMTRLGERPYDTDDGWHLPFSLEALFDPPRQGEIDTVWAQWRARDLDPRDAQIVLRRTVDLDGILAEARIISHRVHGQRHLGAVIVPKGAAPASLPVLVEAKGVSPSFFPLEVPGGLSSPGLLAEDRGKVVYVAPGYRGERLVVGADTLTSEGDRSDAWDGATDDTIALLRVALAMTPEADTSRVCVFGRSRSGTVALLAGMREPRIDCVISWAAPTDWFSRMDLGGWTQAELVADGLANRSTTFGTGGQFINYFLTKALTGQWDLEATRLHLIASSPLYFAGHLPLSQVHWGLEDTIVPSVNGTDLVARYRRSERRDACLDPQFHPHAGHDQDRQIAPRQTRAFLTSAFQESPEEIARCRRWP